MAWTTPTYDELLGQVKADIDARFQGADSRLRRSSLTVLAHVITGVAYPLYLFIAWLASQIPYDGAEAELLARWAASWKVDRLEARFAAGTATFSGQTGAPVPINTRLVSSAGLFYVATQAGVIGGGGYVVLAIEAEAPGLAGNLDTGFSLALVSPLAGINAAVIVAGAGLVGGADAESADSLRARLLERIQMPPHGGAEHDYKAWAKAADPRVTRVWVEAGAMGPGTVTVRFMMDGHRVNGIPTEEDVDAVFAYINPRRPKGMGGLYVVAPIPTPLNFVLDRLEPNTAALLVEIEAGLRDFIQREAVPGGTLLLARMDEVISLSAGEHDHRLASPADDAVADTGHIFVMGTVTGP